MSRPVGWGRGVQTGPLWTPPEVDARSRGRGLVSSDRDPSTLSPVEGDLDLFRVSMGTREPGGPIPVRGMYAEDETG